jgi:hypothetical protein
MRFVELLTHAASRRKQFSCVVDFHAPAPGAFAIRYTSTAVDGRRSGKKASDVGSSALVGKYVGM